MIHAMEAMTRGPAPMRDMIVVTNGKPKTRAELMMVLVLKSLRKLEMLLFLSSIEDVAAESGGEVVEVT